MNYLTFIDRIAEYNSMMPTIQFLVSGNDQTVRDIVFEDLVRKSYRSGHSLMIMDDAGAMGRMELDMLASFAYQIENGMSGEYCLYNPFKISNVKGLSRLRQLLETLKYEETRKAKLTAYLNFIRCLDSLETGSREAELTMEKLGEYCTVTAVEERLHDLVKRGVIDRGQQIQYLSKYSEICSAAADFEDLFFLLMPFISGTSTKPETERKKAFLFQTGELGEDETIRKIILQLVTFGLEDSNTEKITILVFDRGYGARNSVFHFLETLPSRVIAHVFSKDIFSLCDSSGLAMVLNRFTARVYSRHLAMESCEAIEKACGEIDVVKNSYNVTYDRRWRSNRPWDVLLGKNKTESYTKTAPVREPRYRKEMIMSLAPGNGIVEFMGNTSVFSDERRT